MEGGPCTATLMSLARLRNACCSQHGRLLTLSHANVRFPLPTCCTSPASSPTPSVQLLRRWEAGSPLRHLKLLPGTTHILMHLTVALPLTQAMSHSLASFPSPAPSAQLPEWTGRRNDPSGTFRCLPTHSPPPHAPHPDPASLPYLPPLLPHVPRSFLVAGRRDDPSGTFKRLSDITHMPPELADLFEEVPESAFRVDLSSTELRRRAAAQGAAS